MPKILIIQDSPSVNMLLQNRLEASGFSVDTVETGQGGIEKAKSGAYQLILLDHGLPDTDGAQVCRILKKEKALSGCLIIFMSAMDEAGISKINSQAGGDGYISMDFKGQELIDKITGFLKKASQ